MPNNPTLTTQFFSIESRAKTCTASFAQCNRHSDEKGTHLPASLIIVTRKQTIQRILQDKLNPLPTEYLNQTTHTTKQDQKQSEPQTINTKTTTNKHQNNTRKTLE
jgi:hypothetical protein